MKPSRTFTIAMWSITSIWLLGLAGMVAVTLVAILAPEQLEALADFFATYSTIAMSIAAVGGAGAGSMAHRDAKSGGLTSSAQATVLAAHRYKAAAEPDKP